MGYLLTQIFWYCLVAFILGLLVGWWIGRATAGRRARELEERIRELNAEIGDLKREVQDLRARLAEAEEALAGARAEAAREAAKAQAVAAEAAAEVDAAQEAAHHRSGTDVEEIEGIGKGYGRMLKEGGIHTVEQLLEECATDAGVERVRRLTDQEEHVVHTWGIMADLMRIRGLGGQWAELLWRTGVTSVQDLATRDGDALAERMKAVNEKEHRVHELPGDKRVHDFIEAAKEMPRAIPDRPGLL